MRVLFSYRCEKTEQIFLSGKGLRCLCWGVEETRERQWKEMAFQAKGITWAKPPLKSSTWWKGNVLQGAPKVNSSEAKDNLIVAKGGWKSLRVPSLLSIGYICLLLLLRSPWGLESLSCVSDVFLHVSLSLCFSPAFLGTVAGLSCSMVFFFPCYLCWRLCQIQFCCFLIIFLISIGL